MSEDTEAMAELGITPEQVAETKAAEQVEQKTEPEKQQETEGPSEQEQPKAKPEGWDLVDFNKLPEEVRPEFEARFNRLYREVKTGQAVTAQMARDNAALMEAVRKIQSQEAEKGFRSDIDTTKKQIKEAYENGDFDKAADLTVYLTKKQAEAVRPKPEPVKKAEVDTGLTPRQEAVMVEWAVETKPDGTPKRPWAMPGHPKHKATIDMTATVLTDPRYEHLSLNDKLALVDRTMNGEKPKAPTVLSGDGNMRSDRKKETELSPEQKAVARKMFRHLKDADAFAAYQDGMKSAGVYQ